MTTTTTPAPTDDRRLDHRNDCRAPLVVQWVGKRGDPMLYCKNCRAIRNLPPGAEPTPTTEPTPNTEGPTPTTGTPGARATWVRHRPDCPGGALRYRPDGIRAQCLTCGGWGTVPGHEQTPRPRTRGTPEPTTPPPVLATGYRCRDHQEQPVTWRGKGCSQCERERDDRRRNKRKRPATPEPEPSW